MRKRRAWAGIKVPAWPAGSSGLSALPAPQSQSHLETRGPVYCALTSLSPGLAGWGRGGFHLAEGKPQERGATVTIISQHPDNWEVVCQPGKGSRWDADVVQYQKPRANTYGH